MSNLSNTISNDSFSVRINCALCGNDKTDVMAEINSWRIVRCKICKLYYVNPRPDSICLQNEHKRYYTGDRALKANSHWDRGSIESFRGIMKYCKERISTGCVLDIGAGGGFFLHLMKETGYEVEGIEPSSDACAYAEKEFGIKMFCGTLNEAIYSFKEKFDIVTILNVLEHTPNPYELLMIVKKILSPNGIIIITIPNLIFGLPILWFEKLLKKIFGKFCISRFISVFHIPSHLYLFSPKTIKNLLMKAGFRDIAVSNAIPVTNPGKPHKNILKWMIFLFAQIIYKLSGNSKVISYSITAVAK